MERTYVHPFNPPSNGDTVKIGDTTWEMRCDCGWTLYVPGTYEKHPAFNEGPMDLDVFGGWLHVERENAAFRLAHPEFYS